VTDIDQARAARVLAMAVPMRDIDWMVASCPSLDAVCRYAAHVALAAYDNVAPAPSESNEDAAKAWRLYRTVLAASSAAGVRIKERA
jgi:hypothetical protein